MNYKESGNELIPEIHDILKLCMNEKFQGCDESVSPHSRPELVYNYITIGTKTFEGICKHHHGQNFQTFPDTNDLFILDMADNLAAAVSRALKLGKYPQFGIDDQVFKIWRDEISTISKKRQIRPFSIDMVIRFLERNPSADVFFGTYKIPLKQRAEDAAVGANITSLWTHSMLTGKFYRLLKKTSYQVNDEDLLTKETVEKKYDKVEKEWELNIARINIIFPQQAFRTGDLNVLEALKRVQRLLIENYNDYILFSSTNEYLMVFPPHESVELILNRYLEPYGFWYEIAEWKQKIENLTPDPLSLKKEIDRLCEDAEKKIKIQISQLPKEKRTKEVINSIRKSNLKEADRKREELRKEENEGRFRQATIYPIVLTDKIDPPICDICQIFPAKPKIDEMSGLTEYLCDRCLAIRGMGESLRLLGSWENTDVAWIKIKLDFDALINSLRELYSMYLQHVGVDKPEKKAEIRFSVVSEFQEDYKLFLEDLNKLVVDYLFVNGEDSRVEYILNDTVVVKLNTLGEINDLLAKYKNLIDTYFPKFKKNGNSPIRLGISCSHVKFPFFEHWKFLQNINNDIEIQLVGKKSKLSINLEQLEGLLSLEFKNKSAITKLAKIADTSEDLAFLEIFSEDGARKYPEIQKSISTYRLKLSDLYTYIKIRSD